MNQTPVFIRPEEFWRELGLQAGQTVVHMGSGPGFYLIPAAKIVGHSGRAIGIDLLPDLLSEVEDSAKREGVEDIIRVIRANLENKKGSTLPENTADWVLLANILHQSDPESVLLESKRIVKTGGKLVVVAWDVVATPFGPPLDKRISEKNLRELLDKIGCSETSSFSPSPYHYGITCTKSSS